MCPMISFTHVLILYDVNNFRVLTVISLNCLAAVRKLFINVTKPVDFFNSLNLQRKAMKLANFLIKNIVETIFSKYTYC